MKEQVLQISVPWALLVMSSSTCFDVFGLMFLASRHLCHDFSHVNCIGKYKLPHKFWVDGKYIMQGQGVIWSACRKISNHYAKSPRVWEWKGKSQLFFGGWILPTCSSGYNQHEGMCNLAIWAFYLIKILATTFSNGPSLGYQCFFRCKSLATL